jgi:Tol biopolymer transport system component
VAAAIVTSTVVGTAVWFATRQAEPMPPRVVRLSMAPSGAAALTLTGSGSLAITPDGSRLFYVGNRRTQLFVRAIDNLEAVPVFTAATPPLRMPFVSPDSQWIGFSDGPNVTKVAATGGPGVVLTMLDVSGRTVRSSSPPAIPPPVRVDRQGRETPIPALARRYVYPRLSPDGSRIAVVSIDQEIDIWIWNFSRTTLTRSTLYAGADHAPLWTPDGAELIFSSERAGARKNC